MTARRDDFGVGRQMLPTTLASSLAVDLQARLAERRPKGISWPASQFQDDPVGFARRILGIELWSRQIEILEAIRDHERVAVTSGHKTGKSVSAAVAALWWWASWPGARVVMTSTTAHQVDNILWRELRKAHRGAGRCVECRTADPKGKGVCPHSARLESKPAQLARTGLVAPDLRQIWGFSAKEPEAVAGISGDRVLYICDESSGIGDDIFEAISGNLAGGGHILMLSNPTKSEGEFFEAFHGKSAIWKTLKISSKETPNYVTGRIVIPGLATRKWVDERAQEWGEQSAQFKVRVLGEFATVEEGKIISLALITEAETRWPSAVEEGPLYIGLDPAGEGGQGDASVYVARRGRKMIGYRSFRGLDKDRHLGEAVAYFRELLRPRERGTLVLDREGSIGSELWGFLRSSAALESVASLITVRASDRARLQPEVYDTVRDELWASLFRWLRDGGSIPEDVRLSRELHCPEWIHKDNGRAKATPKKEMRKALGRSPDLADALALAVWELPRVDDEDYLPPRKAIDERYDSADGMDAFGL